MTNNKKMRCTHSR